MAEVLVRFDAAVAAGVGGAYAARACGRAAEDGTWEGWIEFEPRDGGAVVRTPRETVQPDRAGLEYWASGLTAVYLEGALGRALHPRTPAPAPVEARPAYDGPAPAGSAPAPPRVRPRTVLDPFAVYAQGEEVLRKELGALDEGHLRSIVRTHDLAAGEEAEMPRARLVEVIMAGVRRRAG